MAKIQKITIFLVLLVVILISVPSCGSTVSQQEYDRLKSELVGAMDQIAMLQSQLAEADATQGQYEELEKNYEDLKKQYDTKMDEIETVKSEYDELTAKYEELQMQYDVIIEEPAAISEEEVEQAIFELINQERQDNGLDALVWGENLYTWAKANSRHMKENARYEYSTYASFQEVFWGAGYSTVERIANGALLTWKSNSYRYELNIINKVTYGTVGAYKSGDIFYITYMADIFK